MVLSSFYRHGGYFYAFMAYLSIFMLDRKIKKPVQANTSLPGQDLYPAVPPCLTLLRPLLTHVMMRSTLITETRTPARILGSPLSVTPSEAHSAQCPCRDPTIRDSLEGRGSAYSSSSSVMLIVALQKKGVNGFSHVFSQLVRLFRKNIPIYPNKTIINNVINKAIFGSFFS